MIAIAAVAGVNPEMTGKTAEYVAAIVSVLTIVFRMFGNKSIIGSK